MASILIDQVSKIYDGGVHAVKAIDIAIEDGEFIVLVGPSGCGKSTLLRMVAGLEAISQGTVSIGGRVVNQVEPAERDIAMVFQNYALYPHMSVYDNLAYGLRNRKTPKAEIEARVTEAARMLEIEPYLKRKPRALSGGQRQRVAIGRAIVRNPKVFLFDEPLSNLDAALRVQMRLELSRLHQELQATMIYVTHDQVEAMTLADKVVVLNGGRIEQVGSPMELYHHPANLFVAGFLGTPKMGFLNGRASRVEASGCEVELDAGCRLFLPVSGATLKAGDPVTLGIRPEHLNRGSEGNCQLTVKADVSERLGSDTYCHVVTRNSEQLTMRIRGDFTPRYGESLSLTLEAAHCHLFDSSGQAVGQPLQQVA
ncbi:MAG: sn-glycerol-3-phosphate ABC transporter ATP-binding protein UgpC [Pseudomonas sp.]|nr:sn-glycerol-3-phosphate ABC transporter ATP-binding protein UgpC [Pseudomonas sp.]